MSENNYILTNEINFSSNHILFPLKKESYVNLRKLYRSFDNVVLLMGLNPAGKEDHKDSDPFIDFFPIHEEDFSNSKDIIKEMTYSKYFKPNYELFKCINAKMYWVNNTETILKIRDKMKGSDKLSFDTWVEREKSKTGPLLIFSDLFHVREENAKVIKGTLDQITDNEIIMTQIKCIMDSQISYYQPTMIVVTNAYASEIIQKYYLHKKDLVDTLTHNGIVFLFSGMISGQGQIDRFSKIRLINAIKENWNY